jgi:uncharacterized protein (DUF4415 family)
MQTPEEDAAIQRGIDTDPENYVPIDEEFAKMKSRGGRPKLEHPNDAGTIRYDAEIIERFRSGGDGWQTRMTDALRDWLSAHA